MYIHTSVLCNECLRLLSPSDEKFEQRAFMIDATLGEGGHSFAFLSAFPQLSIMGIDADSVIQERAKERLAPFGSRMNFFSGWFDDFFADYPADLSRPNLVLFDLGISLFHYELSGRGFSFRHDEPLDMRLSPTAKNSAEDIVHELAENELANLIYNFGEERYSRRIARAVVQERQNSRIKTAKTLADIIWRNVPADYRRGRIHPATKTFQALRIAVNNEFGRLERVLENALQVLEDGGKMGVITFHSLEDRIVKNFFRNAAKYCMCPPEQPVCICAGRRVALITRKPIEATEDEIRQNAPSRSARLRVVRKLEEGEKRHG